MDTIPDTPDQLDATLNVAKAIGKATPMNLASAKAAASAKSASAKPGTVSLGLKGGGKSPSPGKSRAKSPAAGGSVKRPPAKQLGARSPKSPVKATVFNFGAKPTTPPGGQLPAIAGISSLPKDQVEQNTPASKVDQSMDDSRAADWNQLDEDATEEPMPPPARVTPKSKPQSKPTGAVAPKPGGPGDVLHFETARRQAAKEATQAKFWQKAYEAMLRAEHGWRMNFANMPGEPEKPVPEELMVETRTQYQKWYVLIYWADVLEKNSATRLKNNDFLLGERAHTFPRHMFGVMKREWTHLEDAERYRRYEQMKEQIKAEKQLKAQKKRVAAEKKQAQEAAALFDASLQVEAADEQADYENTDDELEGFGESIAVDEESDGDLSGDDSDQVESPHFKRSRRRADGTDECVVRNWGP